MRHTLTDAQFLAYIEIEREAQTEDRIVAALGNQAGVADVLTMAFGGKGSKPASMNGFIGAVGGETGDAATVGDSKEIGELRRRIGAMVKAGEM